MYEQADSEHAPYPARILIVDDDERNLQALAEVLGDLAEVVCAGSGEEALRWLLREQFAVIILDVLMPGMDGYETARLVRMRQQSRDTPIIFLTAINKEDAHLLKGYDSGAVDYVFKPLQPVIVRSKVSVFVSLYEKTREVERKAAAQEQLLIERLKAQAERTKAVEALREAEARRTSCYDRCRSPSIRSTATATAMPATLRSTSSPATFHGSPASSATISTASPASGAGASIRRMPARSRAASSTASAPANTAGSTRTAATGTSLTRRWCSTTGTGSSRERCGTSRSIIGCRRTCCRCRSWMPSASSPAASPTTSTTCSPRCSGPQPDRAPLDPRSAGCRDCRDAPPRGTPGQAVGRPDARLLAAPEPVAAAGGPDRYRAVRRRAAVARPRRRHLAELGRRRSALAGVRRSLAARAGDHEPRAERAGRIPRRGSVSISVADKFIESPTADLKAGPYVVLSVSDSGSGIPAELLDKVVEPFFTTKEVGNGTGLGLSMAYGFARQSGGALRIESTVGVGTVVQIWLPRAADAPAPAAAVAEPKEAPGLEELSILLIDDSASLRDFTRAELVAAGHHVDVASGGAEALATIERSPERYDVIVSDFAMPAISGLDVIKFARNMRANYPAVLITGYADWSLLATRPPDVPVLLKPFALEALEQAIASARRSEPRS